MKERSNSRIEGMRTWVDIDISSITNNYNIFRSIISKKTKLCAVVKSNAYGHDLIQFSKEMEKLGIDFFAVDSVLEGIKLRKEGISKPILVLGYTLPELINDASLHDISVTISSIDSLRALLKIKLKGNKIKVHIKVDTGMHRQGFFLDQAHTLFTMLNSIMSKVEIEGLYTHFASAKNPAFPQYTESQRKVFDLWVNIFKEKGIRPILHTAATGGTMLFPDTHYDMVRVGIGMYGLWPSKESKSAKFEQYNLMPILSWKTIICEIKKVEAGSGIGYDLTEKVQKRMTIAICPVGYWHGYSRQLSSVGHVIIRGVKARVVGRISMDMMVVDVTQIDDVSVLDEVILLGKDVISGSIMSAEELANMSDTINYELVTRINPLTRRIYQ